MVVHLSLEARIIRALFLDLRCEPFVFSSAGHRGPMACRRASYAKQEVLFIVPPLTDVCQRTVVSGESHKTAFELTPLAQLKAGLMGSLEWR
jgi:hypothetical protein